MAKPMTRALRRHHVARLKRDRRFYGGFDRAELPVFLGRVVQTATVCSCWMCGNERKYSGERTVQERRLFQCIGDE
jgi:hypothetical protein